MATALKNEPSPERDAPGDVPEGWALALTGDLFTLVTSGSRGWAEYYADAGALFLRIANLNHDTIGIDLAEKKYVSPPPSAEGTRTRVKVRDLLISITADVGMIGLVRSHPGEAYINQHIALARPAEELDEEYVAWYLASRHGQKQLQDLQRGATKVGLGLDDIRSVDVPLAPLAEQRRIVAKIDELLNHVNASREHLSKVRKVLKAFRQSVLAAACSGRLTEDWRGVSGGSRDGLPTGWRQVSLSEIVPRSGIFDGPFGSNLKTADYTSSGVRVIRMENIGFLSFNSGKRAFISEEKYSSLTKHTVGEGDIIFTSFIEDEIRTCVLPKVPTKAIAKADCFCIRPDKRFTNPHFLAMQLASRESRDALLEEIHGATRPRVNTSQLKRLPIRLSSLPEQNEIVRRVEILFELADKIEKRVAAATKRADKLTQAVLSKAFRGELVPPEAEIARRQGRNYEPASVLLERIKTWRNANVISKNGHRRRS